MRSKLLWIMLVGILACTNSGKILAQASPALGGGELTAQDATDKVRTSSHCKKLGYEMAAGKTYQIDMKSTQIDSYLRLEDPAGQQVAIDDDSGGFPDARIIYAPKESGLFTIVCTTYAGGSTGKFTLAVKEIASPASSPVVTVSNFALNPQGPAVGSNYTVTASVHSREAGIIHAEVLLPQGDRVVSGPADQSITAGGTITVSWTVYCGVSGGQVRVLANLVRGRERAQVDWSGFMGILDGLTLGAQPKFSGELTANDPKDRVRTNSFAKYFTYRMEKGRTYQIDLKSKDFDSYLRLENPAGAQVAFDDDSGGYRDARIIHQAQESGAFKIIATTFIGGTGKFTLTIKDMAPVAGPAPNPTGTANSTWVGTEDLADFGRLTFDFREDGKVTMTDAKVTTNGDWTQSGRTLTLRFINCVYTGQMDGAVFQGTARYTEGSMRTWSFRMERK